METLVQSLLKITRLDAGSVTLEKGAENVADMLRDVELHFAYRPNRSIKNLSCPARRRSFFSATATG